MNLYGNVLFDEKMDDIDFEQVEKILKRPIVKPRYRVSVLNPDESIDYIIPEHDIPQDGISYTEEYQNGQRKNVTLKLINDHGKYTPSINGIWLTTKFRLDIGIEIRNKIIWFPKGVYIMGDVSLTHHDSDRTITSQLKDKYAIFVEKKYVEKMEKESFDILERVRNLTNITKLPITISLGISYSEDSLEERYNAGSSALDIALGRGGDQAVVKKDKKYDFVGGSNIGLEKTSKVKARTMAQAIRELVEESEKVYVVGHRNSDLDCIGASIGIAKIAKYLGKPVNIIVDAKCNASTEGVIENIKYDDE